MSVVDVVREVRYPWTVPDPDTPDGMEEREYLRIYTRDLHREYLALTPEQVEAALDVIDPKRKREQLVKPPSLRGIRRDTEELIAFANKHKLPPAMQAVFDACIRDGLTLEGAAQRLRIGREGVRSHLRKLRAIVRAYRERAETRRTAPTV